MLTATAEPLLLALNVDDALRLYRVRNFERLAVFGSVLARFFRHEVEPQIFTSASTSCVDVEI